MAASMTPGINGVARFCFHCKSTSPDTKQLPCSHIFCLKCLEVQFKNKQADRKLPCPLRRCGRQFTIPASGLTGLPSNCSGLPGFGGAGASGCSKDSEDNHCVICMDEINTPKKLGCGHTFCTGCIDTYFVQCLPKCPSCGKVFGVLRGNQPPGTFSCTEIARRLAGYEQYNTIQITYHVPSGIQTSNHPRPGVPFSGTTRYAYLPACPEGREVCDLLRRAFDAGMIFTIGRSHTTGVENTVVWNDVHHKTEFTGQYGYPDSTYLIRVKYELADKGITS